MRHSHTHAPKPLPAGSPETSLRKRLVHFRISSRRLCTHFFVLCIVLSALLSSSCSKRKPKATIPISTRPPLSSAVGSTEVGVASWYGHPYHGRRTANGEVYDQERMTAAHPSLKFNSWVRVDNLDNGLETTVRINDRGPFAKGRAIDLSRAAARTIAMLGPGTANVRVTVIEPPVSQTTEASVTPVAYPNPSPAPQATQTLYAVQFGAFQSYENALRLRDQVAAKLPETRVVASPSSPSLWLVLGGSGLTREDAEKIVRDLSNDFPRIFPVPAH